MTRRRIRKTALIACLSLAAVAVLFISIWTFTNGKEYVSWTASGRLRELRSKLEGMPPPQPRKYVLIFASVYASAGQSFNDIGKRMRTTYQGSYVLDVEKGTLRKSGIPRTSIVDKGGTGALGFYRSKDGFFLGRADMASDVLDHLLDLPKTCGWEYTPISLSPDGKHLAFSLFMSQFVVFGHGPPLLPLCGEETSSPNKVGYYMFHAESGRTTFMGEELRPIGWAGANPFTLDDVREASGATRSLTVNVLNVETAESIQSWHVDKLDFRRFRFIPNSDFCYVSKPEAAGIIDLRDMSFLPLGPTGKKMFYFVFLPSPSFRRIIVSWSTVDRTNVRWIYGDTNWEIKDVVSGGTSTLNGKISEAMWIDERRLLLLRPDTHTTRRLSILNLVSAQEKEIASGEYFDFPNDGFGPTQD